MTRDTFPIYPKSEIMENLDDLIHNQENHLNELENLKRSIKENISVRLPDKLQQNISPETESELEQINEEIENIYREISVLKIRKMMNAS